MLYVLGCNFFIYAILSWVRMKRRGKEKERKGKEREGGETRVVRVCVFCVFY